MVSRDALVLRVRRAFKVRRALRDFRVRKDSKALKVLLAHKVHKGIRERKDQLALKVRKDFRNAGIPRNGWCWNKRTHGHASTVCSNFVNASGQRQSILG